METAEGFTEQDMSRMLDAPIPGEGLTSDPEAPNPWETPPDYNKVEDFIDALFDNITKTDNLDGVLDPIRKEVPIEDVAQMLLFQAFSTGKITTDLLLGSVEPTIYMLIGLAEYAGIENPVLFPEDDMLDDDVDQIMALEKEAGAKFEELTTPQGVSQSLVNKIKGDKNGN